MFTSLLSHPSRMRELKYIGRSGDQRKGTYFTAPFLFFLSFSMKIHIKSETIFMKKGEKLHMDILQTRRSLDVCIKFRDYIAKCIEETK